MTTTQPMPASPVKAQPTFSSSVRSLDFTRFPDEFQIGALLMTLSHASGQRLPRKKLLALCPHPVAGPCQDLSPEPLRVRVAGQ